MWKTSTLDEICNIEYGTRVVRKKDSGTVYPVYGGGGETFFIDKTNRQDRVVISRFAMSEQCTRFVKGKFFLNDSGLTLSPKTKDLSQYFIDKIILLLNSTIYQLGRGTAQRNLSMTNFRLLKITYPTSVEKQQQIVAKLDATFVEIDKIINSTKEKRIEEKNIKSSILKSIFLINNSQKTIGEIATVIAGQSPEGKYYNKDAKGTPFYQGKKEFGDYELKKPNVWTTKTTKESLKGDVLLSVRAPVGETNMNNEKICIGRGLAAIRANKDNSSEFIYYFLNSIKEQIVGNTGAVFNSINKKQIEDITVPTLTLNEQNKVVNKVKLILSHIKEINLSTKQKLDALNILKSSILKQELKM
jgi:type I restriction enzyme, S subunit